MISRIIDVSVKVHNLPPILNPGYIVVRRSEGTGELWYYGNYEDDKDRASMAAEEINNGVVLLVKKVDEE